MYTRELDKNIIVLDDTSCMDHEDEIIKFESYNEVVGVLLLMIVQCGWWQLFDHYYAMHWGSMPQFLTGALKSAPNMIVAKTN